MSLPVAQIESPARVVPGLPVAGDLADVWLAHALACLLDACAVAARDRRMLVESGVASFAGAPPACDEADELDACRRAIGFAALALEARLNGVLHCCDADERDALMRLAPAERFRLAPRLLHELEWTAEDAALAELVVEVFNARNALVNASGAPDVRFAPDFARAIVEESARICSFLSSLVADAPTATALEVRGAAAALAPHSERLSAGEPVQLPRWDWEWDEFPPNLIGS